MRGTRALDNYARVAHIRIRAASVLSALDIGGAAEWTIKYWGGLQPPKLPGSDAYGIIQPVN